MQRSYEIYVIESDVHWYVGSASGQSTAAKRLQAHLSGYGKAPLLWSKIQELGIDSFTQRILETGEGDAIEAERRWYDWFLAEDMRPSLNVNRPGGWNPDMHKGRTLPPATRIKIGAAIQGKKRTASTRSKMCEAQKGHAVSEEQRSHISATLKAKGIVPPTTLTVCADCAMVSTPGPLAMHCKHTGHNPVQS
jgi:hypothetical protein